MRNFMPVFCGCILRGVLCVDDSKIAPFVEGTKEETLLGPIYEIRTRRLTGATIPGSGSVMIVEVALAAVTHSGNNGRGNRKGSCSSRESGSGSGSGSKPESKPMYEQLEL
jgi:ABC-type spermidine/putrescine transport system permease subunit II